MWVLPSAFAAHRARKPGVENNSLRQTEAPSADPERLTADRDIAAKT
jgi:hypothetical protein